MALLVPVERLLPLALDGRVRARRGVVVVLGAVRRGRFRPAESRSSASVLRRDAVPRAYLPRPPAAAAVMDAAKTSSFSAPMLVLGAAIFLAFLGRSVDSVFQPRDAMLVMRARRWRVWCRLGTACDGVC